MINLFYHIIRTHNNPQHAALLGLIMVLTIGSSTFAQRNSNSDSISQESSTWNPKEHSVPNGSKIHELPKGLPIAAFKSGGTKEASLENFIMEQKVAGLLIIHNGKIRLERYGMEHNRTNLWSSLSVAKSVTSTLVGIAIKDGYIKSVDDYVTQYLPELKGSVFDSVKVRHLLTMTSGIKWNEKYTDPDSDIAGFDKDTTANGVKAIVSYMSSLPAVAKPGEKFNYSTGETHLLGALISSATNQSLSEYLSTKIWRPYGMEQTATWRLDRTNQEMAGCCLQMRLRDFGRFG
ncbi:serine hydrolase, partial [Bizionia echini]|uniref:serine hydrolase domain-containing protein n=1 Tax=Bizionia echini TaxID=649333 RepID=UPI0030D8F043